MQTELKNNRTDTCINHLQNSVLPCPIKKKKKKTGQSIYHNKWKYIHLYFNIVNFNLKKTSIITILVASSLFWHEIDLSLSRLDHCDTIIKSMHMKVVILCDKLSTEWLEDSVFCI